VASGATRARSAGERGVEGVEIQHGELDIEFRQPSGVVETASDRAALHRLCHLKVQPVEPFQPICVNASVVDRSGGARARRVLTAVVPVRMQPVERRKGTSPAIIHCEKAGDLWTIKRPSRRYVVYRYYETTLSGAPAAKDGTILDPSLISRRQG
jgi:hypothetical protein